MSKDNPDNVIWMMQRLADMMVEASERGMRLGDVVGALEITKLHAVSNGIDSQRSLTSLAGGARAH